LERLRMINLLNLKDELGNDLPEDKRLRYVILIDDGKDLLYDPTKNEIWWTYSEKEAKRMVKIIAKDFSGLSYHRKLEDAIIVVARKKYDMEIKKPVTYDSIRRQIMEQIITQKDKSE